MNGCGCWCFECTNRNAGWHCHGPLCEDGKSECIGRGDDMKYSDGSMDAVDVIDMHTAESGGHYCKCGKQAPLGGVTGWYANHLLDALKAAGYHGSQQRKNMKQLTVVYNIPDDAPEWFSQCAEDGDWNGMLEYTMNLRAESIRVT